MATLLLQTSIIFAHVHTHTAWGSMGNCLCRALDKLMSFNYRLSSRGGFEFKVGSGRVEEEGGWGVIFYHQRRLNCPSMSPSRMITRMEPLLLLRWRHLIVWKELKPLWETCFFPALNIALFHILLPPTRVNLSSLRCVFGHDESNCWNIFPHVDRKMSPKGRFQRGMKESIQGFKSIGRVLIIKAKAIGQDFFFS